MDGEDDVSRETLLEEEPRLFPPRRRERAKLERHSAVRRGTAKILSMDDIRRGLSEMAETGEGAQRAQAYRMLMNMESATVTLPTPMTVEEELERVTRFMKALGKEKCQVGWRRAFPATSKEIDDTDKFSFDDLPPQLKSEAMACNTHKKLFKYMGDASIKGVTINGYPKYGSALKKSMWCQTQCGRILLERWKAEGGTDVPAETA